MAYVEAMVALALVLWLNYVRLCLKHCANWSRRDIEGRRRQRARINHNFSHRRLVSSAARFSLDNFAAQLLRCFAHTLNCRFSTGLAPYAILSRDQLAKPDRRGKCASKPMCIGVFNARIRIECALQVVCERA